MDALTTYLWINCGKEFVYASQIAPCKCLNHRITVGSVIGSGIKISITQINEIPTFYDPICFEILEQQKNASNKKRKGISPKLRYLVLRRDNHRCVKCGAEPSESVRLEVDHIIPHSLGGSDNPNNLQTLCNRCNVGKGNRYSD